MKKKVIKKLIKFELIVFVIIIFVAINLILFTNYLDGSVSHSQTSMLDNIHDASINDLQKIKGNETIGPKAADDSSKNLPKQISSPYLVDLQRPEDKIHDDLKKKIRKKSKKRVRVIVEVKDETSLEPVSDIIENSGGIVEGKFEIGDSIIADVPLDQIEELAGNDDVVGLWDDKEYNMLLDTSVYQVNAPFAWDLGYDGNGIKIAVLDTGIDDTNEMLSGKVVAAEVFTNENHTEDRQGHGTHIAGIIAGNGLYKGVAPAALLMNAKVLTDSGSGSTSTILKGINWAVENGADIISMSLGRAHDDPDEPLNKALKDAIDAGVIVVVSAGNCGEGCSSGGCGSFRGVTKPSDFEDVITVGAVDKENNWACFSSGQEFEGYIKPDLVAPGVSITSSYLGSGYKTRSGTSISAPFIAGVAALMLQKNSSLDHYSLKSLLENNAVDLGVEGKDVKYGSGIIDIDKFFNINEENDTNNLNDTYDNINNTTGVKNKTNDLELNESVNLNHSVHRTPTESSNYSIQTVIGGALCSTYPDAEWQNVVSGDKCYTNNDHIGVAYQAFDLGYDCDWSNKEFLGEKQILNGDKKCWDFTPNKCYYRSVYYCDDLVCECTQEQSIGCGSNYIDDDGNRCDSDQVLRQRSCSPNGCSWEKLCADWVEPGLPGCPECLSDSDCGSNERCSNEECVPECTSNNYYSCYNNDIYWYDSCDNRGNKKEDCGSDSCESFGSNYCKNGDVYHQQTCYDKGCSGNSCYSNPSTNEEKVQDCSNGCSGGACVTVSCGDGTCSSGENCPKDCLKVDSFYQLPSAVSEDDNVNIKVVINNIGTVSQTGKVEVAIIPTNFYTQGTSGDITGCCEANKYFDTRQVTRAAGESQFSTFNIKVPAKNSIDSCDYDGSPNSAWGTSFKVTAGAYVNCGEGYYSEKESPITVNELCTSSQCTSYHWRDCNDKGTFCCSGDDSDGDPNTEYPQYYCENSLDYTDCSNSDHTACMERGGKYCTEESGLWKFRDCSSGCSSGACNPDPCGDNLCNNGETSSSCPTDCYSDIVIESISSISPPTAKENDEVTFTAIVTNKGTVQDSRYIEGAVVPESWAGIVYPTTGYSAQTVSDNPFPVCPGNSYYQSKIVDLVPGESNSLNFAVTAPNQNSVDDCDENTPKRSAWDTSFRIIAGTYEQLSGGSYESFNSTSYNVEVSGCTSDDNCSSDGYIGDLYCLDGDVNRNFKFGDCNLGSCGTEERPKLIESCNYGCSVSGGSAQCNQKPQDCAFIDGSSWDCECDSNIECMAYGDYYCDFVSGPDACEVINYADECSNYNDFFCENNWVKKCVDNGKHWEKLKIESCSGRYKYCDSGVVAGTGSCSKHPENLDVWIDYADTGVVVNKQPGDKLKLNIYSDNAATVKISYDANVFDSDDCFTFHAISPGVNTCNLVVKENIEDTTGEIKVQDTIKEIKIINNPDLLIITDSEKLNQEFNQEQNAVKAVLKQAYANAKDKGVVYDLSWYKDELGVNNPFTSFISYFERIFKPDMVDNSYSIAVSNFVKDRCENCKDVMIVGDDFVVPGYRNSIPMSEGISLWGIVDWFEDRINIPIYTDTSYIQRKMSHKISDIDQIEENVYFILPDNLNDELLLKIRNLENTIKSKFNVKIHEKYGSEVECDDVGYFDSFNDVSLFIIGDHQNNPSLKCYPFVELEENMLTIQPNIWDTEYLFDDSKSFTVILSTMNATVIENFEYIISTGMYADIQTKSAIIGYTLMAVGVVGTGAVIIGAVTVGSPVIILGGLALAAVSITNECVINNAGGNNWGWCGVGATLDLVGGQLLHLGFKASKPIVKWTVKNTIGKVGTNLIGKHGDNFLQFTYDLVKNGKYKSFVRALGTGSKYPDDVYRHVLKRGYSNTEIDNLAKYQKLWGGNPYKNADEAQNLVRIYDSKFGDVIVDLTNPTKRVKDSAVLLVGKETGDELVDFGWTHIKLNHLNLNYNPTKSKFIRIIDGEKVLFSEGEVLDLIRKTLTEGIQGKSTDPGTAKTVFELAIEASDKVKGVRVVLDGSGQIISALPLKISPY